MTLPHPIARLALLFGPLLAIAVGCKPPAGPPQMPPPPGVTVARPVAFPVQNYYEYNGYLEGVEEVKVQARVKGLLKEIKFKEGDEVKAGDELYQIDPREFRAAVAKSEADIAKAASDVVKADSDVAKAESDVAKAESDIDLAKASIIFTGSELKRQELLARSATSASELQKARSAAASDEASLKAAEASKKAAQAGREASLAGKTAALANKQAAESALATSSLSLEYTSIKAEIAGRISRTLVTRGNLVGQSDPTLLTTIVRQDELFVYFDAAERDLIEYIQRPRDKAASPSPSSPVYVAVGADEGYPYTGEIDFRDNRVNTSTGTVRIRGLLKNPKQPGGERKLYPGLFSRVRVPYGAERPLPVIPEEALMTGQEGRYVYVADSQGNVAKRTVTVGPQVWRALPPSPDAAAKPLPAWAMTMSDKPGPVVRSVVAITAGLTVDDLVVVNGLQKVRPGAPVAPMPAELTPPAPAKN